MTALERVRALKITLRWLRGPAQPQSPRTELDSAAQRLCGGCPHCVSPLLASLELALPRRGAWCWWGEGLCWRPVRGSRACFGPSLPCLGLPGPRQDPPAPVAGVQVGPGRGGLVS